MKAAITVLFIIVFTSALFAADEAPKAGIIKNRKNRASYYFRDSNRINRRLSREPASLKPANLKKEKFKNEAEDREKAKNKE